MPAQKLKEYLDDNKVGYESISHTPAYSAQTVAATAHIPGKDMVKTVIVKVDDRFAMAVLPASFRVHLGHLKKALSAEQVELATEQEFEKLFPDCERGAMPPFGNLYDMDVYVAKELAEDEEIAFSAGSHDEIIRMSYNDFENLVGPTTASLT